MPVTEQKSPTLGNAAPSSKRLKIALYGVFGVQNIGNEYTLQAMLYNVRERLPSAEVYCVCYEPRDTQCLHQLPTIRVKCAGLSRHRTPASNVIVRLFRGVWRRIPLELYDWFRTVWALRSTDLMIMTGTGMLTDYLCGSFGFPYDVFKWTLSAKLARCEVRFVGVGVGPIYGRMSRVFIKTAMALADSRGFRDEQSRNRLKLCGFERTKDAVFPDLAFSLPQSALQESTSHPGTKPVVGIGVMKFVDLHSGTDYDAVYERYIETMCNFSIWLLEHGYGVRILLGDMKHDPPVREDLEARLSARGVTYGVADILAPAIASPEDLVVQLARVDFVVSPRFHNLVFGIMLGKPGVSLSYDAKNDALLEAFGLGEYCQSIEDVDLNRLIAQFIDLESQAPRLRIEMHRKTEEYRRLLQEQYSQILGDSGPNRFALPG